MALSGITLLAQPSITIQPASQTVLAGSNVLFSVMAEGAGPLSYQWQFNETNLPNDIIKTFAGTGQGGYSGDGGAATNSRVYMFGGLAFDNSGNLYLSDWYNSRIRKLDNNGIITTVAGNGSQGYSGDGGAATNASLNGASGVALDLTGNLFIADGGNNCVRKVDTNGMITTVAGTGVAGFFGDGGAATSAQLDGASGVCFDKLGQLYISDYRNNRIRKVATNGIITTVAGSGGAGFGTGGFSGDGRQATTARLNQPFGVTADDVGNLYIADGNNRIRKVGTNGIITTVAGNGTTTYSGDGGPATNASLRIPLAVAVGANGDWFIADYLHSRIRKVDTNGTITTVAGNGGTVYSGDGGTATNAGIVQPSGIAVDTAGNLFINAVTGVREVSYAGCPTLTLNQVTTSGAGDYRVIVSSSEGSITSNAATLTVQMRPSISGLFSQPDGTVALSFTGTPNSTNRVWVATRLAPPVVWFAVSTNVAGADGAWQFTDTSAIGWPTRFYRVSMP
jgi:sugar lactone lactonase YvrE